MHHHALPTVRYRASHPYLRPDQPYPMTLRSHSFPERPEQPIEEPEAWAVTKKLLAVANNYATLTPYPSSSFSRPISNVAQVGSESEADSDHEHLVLEGNIDIHTAKELKEVIILSTETISTFKCAVSSTPVVLRAIMGHLDRKN